MTFALNCVQDLPSASTLFLLSGLSSDLLAYIHLSLVGAKHVTPANGVVLLANQVSVVLPSISVTGPKSAVLKTTCCTYHAPASTQSSLGLE